MQKEVIASIKNPRIKRWRLLQESATFREERGEFVLEGVRLIEDAIDAGAVPEDIFYDERLLKREGGEKLLSRLSSLGADISRLGESLLDKLSDTVTPQGIIGTFKSPSISLEDLLVSEGKGLLVLDGVQDPGNVGTLIRTAAAFDLGGVLLLPGCADAFNLKTIRATAGAIFRIPVAKVKNVKGAMEKVKARNFKVVVAHSGGGSPIEVVNPGRAPALVIGNEGRGPSEEVMAIADEVVMIPMANRVESLNAAVAGALLIYEFCQRRRKNGAL